MTSQIAPTHYFLCFAHRGEARSFFKHYSWQEDAKIPELYHAPHLSLLITGEGLFHAMTKLGLALGQLQTIEQLEVWNLGVAAALRPELEIGQIYDVGTVYGEDQFHSFDLGGTQDIITAKERVLDDKKAQQLSAFAPIVERELWGVCHIAHAAKRQVHALKLISDRANNNEICAQVRDESLIWSERLYQAWSERTRETLPAIQKEIATTDPLNILNHQAWHFSATQRRQYQSLLKLYQIKELNFDRLQTQKDQLSPDLRPKQKVSKLLEWMNQELFPFETNFKFQIEKLLSSVCDQKLQIELDPQFEQAKAKVTFEIESLKDWPEILNRLQTIPHEKLWKLIEGQGDHV